VTNELKCKRIKLLTVCIALKAQRLLYVPPGLT